VPDTNWWFAVASSADGNELVAAGGGIQDDPRWIYVSTNAGSTWVQSSAPAGEWIAVAASSDGTRLAAADISGLGSIYTSTNSGTTWISNSLPPFINWSSVASSATGNKLVAVGFFGSIYSSTNFGATWETNDAPDESWEYVVSSADGNKLAAVVWPGGIYTSQSTPSPQLNLAPSGSNLTVSWIVPSTNFVLQQNLDLTATNWSDVTNPPVLDLTNLQDEVILLPTNSSSFYRLKTP